MTDTQIIDSHCHLYLEDFSADIEQVIERAEREGVREFYLPAIDSTTHEEMMALESRYAGKCFSMMGLHPCSVKENYRQELSIVQQWLSQRAFAAIGEIGLDYYWDRSFDDQQKTAFRQQVEWALEYKLPIVIHSRDSLDECIGIVRQYQNGLLKGVFHCFSGTAEQAARIVDLGFYMGIGGVITFKNSGLAPVVKNIPLENILLETDAPYLTPAPFRGKRNESSYLKYVVEKLAGVKQVDKAAITRVTTQNAQNLFGR